MTACLGTSMSKFPWLSKISNYIDAAGNFSLLPILNCSCHFIFYIIGMKILKFVNGLHFLDNQTLHYILVVVVTNRSIV